MSDHSAIPVVLGDGFGLDAEAMRREPNQDLTADLMLLEEGRIVFADRAVINTEPGRRRWATEATGPGRPTAERLAEAILLFILPTVIAARREERARQSDDVVALATARAPGMTADWPVGIDLFHDPNGVPYATLPVGDHRESHPIETKRFRHLLAASYRRQHGTGPCKCALSRAIERLVDMAQFDAPELPVHVRLAERDGAIYLDLGDDAWQVVEVTAAGWRLITDPPVKFRRPRGMEALPLPVPGGSVGELRRFVNVADDNDWTLLLGWLLGALRGRGPFPVLALQGGQGSAKSTLTRILKRLIDPYRAPIRTLPKSERDLMIAATNAGVLAFDNLSHLTPSMSDAFCRLATGGGLGTRTLYSDAEETLFEAQRPLILNGIEELVTRDDLGDRTIVLDLPAIVPKQRRPEADVWRDFEEAWPRIFGALLDAVSVAMGRQQEVHLPGLPRMADFAQWVVAAEPALGVAPGTFLQAYAANRQAATALTLEASPIAQAVRDFIGGRAEPWCGTATELLAHLDGIVTGQARRPTGWPSDARMLANGLRRLAPALLGDGVSVEFGRSHGGKRLIRIEVLTG